MNGTKYERISSFYVVYEDMDCQTGFYLLLSIMYLVLFHKSMCMTGRSYSSSPPLRDKIFLSTILACCFKFVKSLRVLQFCGKHVMSRDII